MDKDANCLVDAIFVNTYFVFVFLNLILLKQ